VLPVLAMLCRAPLSATPRPLVLEHAVFGSMVRDEVTPLVEISQTRVFPLLALWLLAVAFVELLLRLGRQPLTARNGG
jgi:hypothetical protein